MKKKTTVPVVVVASVAALGIGIFGGTVIAAAIAPASLPPAAELSVNAVDEFPTNEAGLTYGFVDQGLSNDPGARAELVLVTTDEGHEGWAYFKELVPAHFATTPREAEALSTDQPYKVAVYEPDGITLIGYQTVNRPAD